jgi:hypothetical protein
MSERLTVGVLFVAGISTPLVAGPIVQLTYTEYLDNTTEGYWPTPSGIHGPSLSVPIGSSAKWTTTLDVAAHDYTPSWTLSSTNLPPGLSAVGAPTVIFWSLDPNTHSALDAIRGVAPGYFTWQGLTYLAAYTIQFPNCPIPGSCTATTLGPYYLPGGLTYAATTYDSLSSSLIPEPSAFSLLSFGGLALVGILRLTGRKRQDTRIPSNTCTFTVTEQSFASPFQK